ncbi:MAG: antitoxin Xre-like helix-turn-helix domain-containing protein [Marinobacter sp.]|uniref:antitoxin Xre-like helix-turn-helix domain-containing protein n=1 Tax=Marinobacter sp. TaxID=50741 RepID=UPI00396E233C
MERPGFSKATAARAGVALKAAFNILDKWGCSTEQQRAIVQLPKSSYYKLRNDPTAAKLNADQVERISYLLNIHASLRLIFENPKNLYGYMSMKNEAPPFNGMAPLDVIAKGRFGPLYETFKHVDSLRGGQW